MTVTINCDMGESFSVYRMGDDAGIMPFISLANVACGFHASDPNHMRTAVDLAQRNGVRVGAHPSLPDLQGFGRRELTLPRTELANMLVYQIGALTGFLKTAGMTLSHIKPHGSLYTMAARDEETAHAVCDAADIFPVPLLGITGSLHEQVYNARGHEFVAEYFADLEYGDDGVVIITREHSQFDPDIAAERAQRAIATGETTSISGKTVQVRADTVCVHSDTPNAVEVARAVRDGISSASGTTR
jgi:UPF0271 protein